MNREVKFRGKDSTLKQWIYGDLLQYNDGSICIGERSKTFTDDGYQNPSYSTVLGVDEETIGQFTGLYDKHSKEVYEYDILRVFDGKSYFNVTVVWSEKAMAFMCCFCDNNLSPLSWFSNILSKCYEIEVIGNKFDNHELLEE